MKTQYFYWPGYYPRFVILSRESSCCKSFRREEKGEEEGKDGKQEKGEEGEWIRVGDVTVSLALET